MVYLGVGPHLLLILFYFLEESFIVLYKELQYRHIYAKHKVTIVYTNIMLLWRHRDRPSTGFVLSLIFVVIFFIVSTQPTLEQRFESYQNYIDLFNLTLGTSIIWYHKHCHQHHAYVGLPKKYQCI